MRVFIFVGLLTGSFASSLFALNCHTLLAVGIGSQGPSTVSFNKDEGLIWYHDGIQTGMGSVTPDFRLLHEPLTIWMRGQVKSFAVQPLAKQGAFFLALDSNGILRFATPSHLLMSVDPGEYGTIGAAAFYQPSFRERERDQVPMNGLRSALPTNPPLSSRQQNNLIASLEESLPTQIYIAVGNEVFRATVTPVFISPEGDVGRALLKGPIRVTEKSRSWGDLEPTYRITPLAEQLIDFRSADDPSRILIAGSSPNRAFQVAPFIRVVGVKDRSLMEGIDFLQVLSPTTLFVGSEDGKMLIVDSENKEVLHKLSCSGTCWLSSVSSHQIGNEIQVWAINSADKKIHQWSSQQNSTALSLFPAQLPSGEIPVSIATAGQLLPVRSRELRNYFSDVFPASDEVAVRRVLALSTSGKLYGLTYRRTLTDPNPAPQWESHVFQQ